MTDGGGSPTNFDDHSGVAEKILRIIERFADELAERQVPAHLEHVVRDEMYLKGSRIGQHPERFVEEQLVWPMLDTFDYEFWSQPYGYPKWDSSRPDFAVRNFDCGTECAVIGEVKTPNKFEYADDQILEYLSRDLEEATIGFATDAVQWRVYARPERHDGPTELANADFSRAFQLTPARHLQKESYSTHEVRQTLTDAEELTRSAIQVGAYDVLSN